VALKTKDIGSAWACAVPKTKDIGSACAFAAPKTKDIESTCAYVASKTKGNRIGLHTRAEEQGQELVCICMLRKKSTELDMWRAEDKECGSICAYASLHS